MPHSKLGVTHSKLGPTRSNREAGRRKARVSHSKLGLRRLKFRAPPAKPRASRSKLGAAWTKLGAGRSKLGVRHSKLRVRHSKLQVGRPKRVLWRLTSPATVTYDDYARRPRSSAKRELRCTCSVMMMIEPPSRDGRGSKCSVPKQSGESVEPSRCSYSYRRKGVALMGLSDCGGRSYRKWSDYGTGSSSRGVRFGSEESSTWPNRVLSFLMARLKWLFTVPSGSRSVSAMSP